MESDFDLAFMVSYILWGFSFAILAHFGSYAVCCILDFVRLWK